MNNKNPLPSYATITIDDIRLRRDLTIELSAPAKNFSEKIFSVQLLVLEMWIRAGELFLVKNQTILVEMTKTI